MKKYIYSAFAALILAGFASCMDDKGGNDFDTLMPGVEMEILNSAYSGNLGAVIDLKSKVVSAIDESDLTYYWEVNGDVNNEHQRDCFSPIGEGKELSYTCRIDSIVGQVNRSYTLRMHAVQHSTGRNFYSSNTATLTIQGLTGLMVLNGDDKTSNVGILIANEFMPSSSSLPEEPSASPRIYEGLQGRGKSIFQWNDEYLKWYSPEVQSRAWACVSTDQDYVTLSKDGLAKYGSWDDFFYLSKAESGRKGEIKGVEFLDGKLVIYDSEEIYVIDPTQTTQTIFSEFDPSYVCGDGHTYVFTQGAIETGNDAFQAMFYANKVDGQARKGFVGCTQIYYSSRRSWANHMVLVDPEIASGSGAAFDASDMKSDLVTMYRRVDGHVYAIMHGDSNHPTQAGKYYMAELDVNAEGDGTHPYSGVPANLYDFSALPGASEMQYFAQGENNTLNYYTTTSGKAYQYIINGGVIAGSNELRTTDGTPIAFEGEITMFKFLASPAVSTYNEEPILLVATYNGGKSRLYALHISTAEGSVISTSIYDASTVKNWDFDKIYDVNIKGL